MNLKGLVEPHAVIETGHHLDPPAVVQRLGHGAEKVEVGSVGECDLLRLKTSKHWTTCTHPECLLIAWCGNTVFVVHPWESISNLYRRRLSVADPAFEDLADTSIWVPVDKDILVSLLVERALI